MSLCKQTVKELKRKIKKMGGRGYSKLRKKELCNLYSKLKHRSNNPKNK